MVFSFKHSKGEGKVKDYGEWGNECLERIKVAEGSRIKNESVPDINFTVLLKVTGGGVFLFPSLSLFNVYLFLIGCLEI